MPHDPIHIENWLDAGARCAVKIATDAGPAEICWMTLNTTDSLVPESFQPGVVFEPVSLEALTDWFEKQLKAMVDDTGLRRHPRIQLPCTKTTGLYCKQMDPVLLRDWADRGGWLLVWAEDYTETAVDLKRWLNHAEGLVLILDDFAQDAADGWQAGLRLAHHFNVFALSRGLPGVPASFHGTPPEQLPPEILRRAEGIFHAAVGEVGTECLLFGSGLSVADLDYAVECAAIRDWYAQPRPWLDKESLALLMQGNAERLAKRRMFDV